MLASPVRLLYSQPPSSFAVAFARGARLLYSVHGYHFAAKAPLIRSLGAWAERRCSGRADLTIFVCDHDRRLAQSSGILRHAKRYQVIPNGIETDRLPSAAPSEARVLGFAGRLVAQKDPLQLIEVLARLRDDGFRLRIIGDGPLRGAVQGRAAALGVADRIEILGSIPRSQALAELSALGVEDLLAARYDKFRRMGSEGQAFVDTSARIPSQGS